MNREAMLFRWLTLSSPGRGLFVNLTARKIPRRWLVSTPCSTDRATTTVWAVVDG